MAAAKNSKSIQFILLFPGASSNGSPLRSFPSHPFLFLFSVIIIFCFLFLSIFLVVLLLSVVTSVPTPSTCPLSAAPRPPPATSMSAIVTLPVHDVDENSLSPEEREFWRQPDGSWFWPCIMFSLDYRKASAAIIKEKRRFLMVVVDGELIQMRSQIVDAVVIARILGAVLVLPIFDRDDSEFLDIFDVDHFKETLKSDLRIVSSLPSTHLRVAVLAKRLPFYATPLWIRTKYRAKLNKHGVLLLKGFYSRLSKHLPLDLQRLRCKVAFQALRFAAHIRTIGNRLAERMWMNGPYIAIHLNLDKDVWVRTGCLPGLSPELDALVAGEWRHQVEHLSRLNLSYHERRAAGLCPLNAHEIARLLKALGAPRSAGVYWGSGEALGGARALEPLTQQFPHLTSRENLAWQHGELDPLMNRSLALAAIDYIVFLRSDVFVPSHASEMGQALQGHRIHAGHRKSIEPDKRALVAALSTDVQLSDQEFSRIMKHAHRKSLSPLETRAGRRCRGVTEFPIPVCVCVQAP